MNPKPFDIRALDGGRIPAYSWSRPDGSGKLALVVHGFGDHGRALPYQLLAAFLSSRGFGVVSYDQRGHGAIAPKNRGVTTWSALVDDAQAVTATLRQDYPRTTLAVIGLSMGALVALEAAQLPGISLEGVVAAAAPLGAVRASRFALSPAKHLGRWFPRLPLRPKLDLSSIAADAQSVTAYLSDPFFHQVMRAGFAFQLLNAIERLRLRSSLVQFPTLFLHGTSDRIAPWEPAFSDGVRAELRRVRLFPGLLHNLFLDTHRSEVFGQIADWLGELLVLQPRLEHL